MKCMIRFLLACGITLALLLDPFGGAGPRKKRLRPLLRHKRFRMKGRWRREPLLKSPARAQS